MLGLLSKTFVLLVLSGTGIWLFGQNGFSDTHFDGKLLIASAQGKTDEVRQYLKEGANPNSTNSDGVTPLMYAAQGGFIDIVALLIEAGADVNAKPHNEVTALHAAIDNGQFEIAELLIRSNTRMDVRDNFGLTPLHYAVKQDAYELADMLLYYNASSNLADYRGTSPLMLAAWTGNFEMARLLIRHGASIDTTDYEGNTALIVACQNKHPDVVRLLLANKANPSHTNSRGTDALLSAIKAGDGTSVAHLIKSSADINKVYHMGLNPLEAARMDQNDTLMDILRSTKAKPDRFPWFNQVTSTVNYRFSGRDSYWYLGLGLQDSKYHLAVEAGAGIRPKRRAVWENQSGITYQYQEQRWLYSIDINKSIYFPNNRAHGIGINVGVTGVYSDANYRGTDIKPGPVVIFVPHGGILYRGSVANIHFSYLYQDFGFENLSPHFFELGFGFYFNRKKFVYHPKNFGYLQQ